MSQESLKALINGTLIDNNIQFITPKKLREVLIPIVEEIVPSNPGAVSAIAPLFLNLFNNDFTYTSKTTKIDSAITHNIVQSNYEELIVLEHDDCGVNLTLGLSDYFEVRIKNNTVFDKLLTADVGISILFNKIIPRNATAIIKKLSLESGEVEEEVYIIDVIYAERSIRDQMKLNPSGSTPEHEEGLIYYDGNKNSLMYMDDISGKPIMVGFETLTRGKNDTGFTITKGSVVYISGASGQIPTIGLAKADSDLTCEFVGIASDDIIDGGIGKVCVFGDISGLDTSSFSDGRIIYLSADVAGGITSTIPASPNLVVELGVVKHSDNAIGRIFLRPGRPLSNNNSLGTSQKFAATENSIKNYVDSLIVGLWNDRGVYDASSNAYPSSGGSGIGGAIRKGDIWTVSVAGTLPTSQVVEPGDTVRALINTPGNTQANWAIMQNNIGYVPQPLLVSGTNIKTINGSSILGSGDLVTSFVLQPHDITSASLDSLDIDGVKTYLNNKSPVISTPANALLQITVTDTGQVFNVELNNRSFGSGQPAISNSDLTLIKDIDYEKLFPIKHWYQATGLALSVYGTNTISTQGTVSQTFYSATGQSYTKIASAATSGTTIYARESSFGRIIQNRGFYFEEKIKISDASTISDVRGFHGLHSTAGFGNTDISANLSPMVGFACDGADTNWQLMHQDTGAGSVTKVNLGASFAKESTGDYKLIIIRLAGSSKTFYEFINLGTSVSVKGNFTNNPLSLTLVNHRNTNASNISAAFEIERAILRIQE